MRQLIRITPGGTISATEFNRAMAEIEKAIRITVSSPLQLTQGWDSQNIALKRPPGFFVRITGHMPFSGTSGGHCSGGSSGAGYDIPAYFYSGIEQISYLDGTVEDNDTGIEFDVCNFPLVEMSLNEDVPADAIVWAAPSASNDHYEFLWEDGIEAPQDGSGCGSGCSTGIDLRCLIRCTPTGLQVQSGCFYVVINGQKFYVQFE